MDDCLIIELPEFKPQYKRWKNMEQRIQLRRKISKMY